MPEGDTLHSLAARLRPQLMGQTLTEARSRDRGPWRAAHGLDVCEVLAVGKNLVIHLSEGWSVRVHLGIGGRCRIIARERQRYPASKSASLVLGTDAHVVVFTRAPQVELSRTVHLRASPALRRLGPDLLADEVALDDVVRRARKLQRERSMGELLLDQRVAAGIGNVVKNEVLFMRELDPWRAARDLRDDALSAAYGLARDILLASVEQGRRITVPADLRTRGGPELWVHGRTGEPCLRCGTTIMSRRQGDAARMTYFCPSCQS